MPAGVYLHIPFCRSRCSYCDFATDVFRNADTVNRYVDALVCEIKASPEPPTKISVDTIYFGGGTPSLLSPDQVGKILDNVKSMFDVGPSAEITMEMNPATVTAESLAGYRKTGVNRASFGVQTFDDTELKRLARGHTADDARQTYRLLRDSGFENVSFDLIAGLPGQTLAAWESNVDEALSMRPEHLSLYLLEIHEGTPLAEQVRAERRPLPDAELAAKMYESLIERLQHSGFAQYEISNFALPGYESRHNTKYWTLEPVYAFGVSAHSFDGRNRYANDRDTNGYVRAIEQGGTPEVFREKTDLASEAAFLGLRLTRGINLPDFSRRFGIDIVAEYQDEINGAVDSGLLELTDERLRLTRKGMLYSNEVFRIFV